MEKIKQIIDLFGGLTEMSRKIGVPISTIQSWRDKGKIPAWRYQVINDASNKYGIKGGLIIETNDNELPDITA